MTLEVFLDRKDALDVRKEYNSAYTTVGANRWRIYKVRVGRPDLFNVAGVRIIGPQVFVSGVGVEPGQIGWIVQNQQKRLYALELKATGLEYVGYSHYYQ